MNTLRQAQGPECLGFKLTLRPFDRLRGVQAQGASIENRKLPPGNYWSFTHLNPTVPFLSNPCETRSRNCL